MLPVEFEQKYERMVKKKILDLFRNTNAIIFLFGSRSKGDYKKGSDYDIGVEAVNYETFRKLKIQFDIFWEESIIPYKVDIVYFDHVSSSFKKEAKKNIVLWKTD